MKKKALKEKNEKLKLHKETLRELVAGNRADTDICTKANTTCGYAGFEAVCPSAV